MGVLSENNYNDIDRDNEDLPDIFLQNEFLSLNNQVKDRIRDLLTDNKVELSAKDIKILMESLKESYLFDSKLKQRIHQKNTNYERNKIKRSAQDTFYSKDLKEIELDLEDNIDY